MAQRTWLLGFFSLFISATVGVAHAQDYPSKVIKLVSPFAAGGPSDPPARWIASKLTESLGQPVIVEFRGGAASVIGTSYVAKSPADGHTLLFTTNSFILIAVTRSNLPFHPSRDFAPLTPVTDQASILVVGPSLRVKTVPALIANARRNPGKISFASSGTGGPLHLYGELFKTVADVNILHVPYKGAGPAAADLVGGVVDMAFIGLSGALPLIKAGKVTALAAASGRRSPALPDLPTMLEAGVSGFEEVNSRYQMLAPGGTPEPVLTKLHASIVKAVHDQDTRAKFASLGVEPFTSSRAEYARYIDAQITMWMKVARAAGVKPK